MTSQELLKSTASLIEKNALVRTEKIKLGADKESFILWVANNIAPQDLILSLTKKSLVLEWYSSFIDSTDDSLADENFEDFDNEDMGLGTSKALVQSELPLYNSKLPDTHQAVPVSFLGLPIFNAHDKGKSLKEIDQQSFQKLVEFLDLRLKDPKIEGEILDPIMDARILKEILRHLLNEGESAFEVREKGTGKVIREGKLFTIDYFQLLSDIKAYDKDDVYSRYNSKRPKFFAEVRSSLARIKALRMNYLSDTGKAEFESFFSYLHLDPDSYEIKVIASDVIYQLFRDDRILTINSNLMNTPTSGIESVLLHFISSLKAKFQKEVGKPIEIRDPVSLSLLVGRCYPFLTEMEIKSERGKRKVVADMMTKLKKNHLLAFDEKMQGQKIYYNIICYSNLTDEQYSKVIVESKSTDNVNNLAGYLSSFPLPNIRNMPKEKSDKLKLQYTRKHIDCIYALARDNNDASLKKNFVGLDLRLINRIGEYAELAGHDELVATVSRIIQIRETNRR